MPEDQNLKVVAYRELDEAIAETERELNVRSRCFPRWIADGRVSRIDARDRLDRLATALVYLETLAAAPERCTTAELRTEVLRRFAEAAPSS